MPKKEMSVQSPLITGKVGTNGVLPTPQIAASGLPENFRRIADRFLQRFHADTSIRTPRSDGETQDLLAGWFARYESHFTEIMLGLWAEEFPNIKAQPEGHIREILRQNVLPLVEPELRSYALRGIAGRWAARRYPNGVGISPPEKQGDQWFLPVKLRSGVSVGQIVLDNEGNILEAQTTSGEQIGNQLAHAH